MATDKIYDNLGDLLKQHWTIEKHIEKNESNTEQYFNAFSDLRYFVDRKTGEFLYEKNEKGQRIGLNYEAIYEQSPELTIKDKEGKIDKEKSNVYINEAFKNTNENFQKLKLIYDLSNCSRFHTAFGKGRATSYFPSVNIDLLLLQNASDLYSLIPIFINNSINLMEKIDKNRYESIAENFENAKKSQNPEESKQLLANSMNLLLTGCSNAYSKIKDKKFNLNNYLDEKLTNISSALDDIDKDECSKPLMKNRSTNEILFHFSPAKFSQNTILIDKDVFNKYATRDLKDLLKKYLKNPEED